MVSITGTSRSAWTPAQTDVAWELLYRAGSSSVKLAIGAVEL